jgi:hypothetical protein
MVGGDKDNGPRSFFHVFGVERGEHLDQGGVVWVPEEGERAAALGWRREEEGRRVEGGEGRK